MANIAYMKQILKHIEDNPQTWNQATWRCDSGMCFAGWAVDLSDRFDWAHTLEELKKYDGGDYISRIAVIDRQPENGRDRMHVGEAAEILLGVHGDDDLIYDWTEPDSDTRNDLFDANNSIDDLRRLIGMYEDAEKKKVAQAAAAGVPNVPLLQMTLKTIEDNPAHWAQTTWRCNSGMCFAGWAVQLSGYKWAANPEDIGGDHVIVNDNDPVLPMLHDGIRQYREQYGTVPAHAVATALLNVHEDVYDGVAPNEVQDAADNLFDGTNSMQTLRAYVQTLVHYADTKAAGADD